MFADARTAIGAQPVSAAAPAGTDIRREPEFDAIEAEVRRMDSDGPGAVRWRSVIDSSSEVLSQRSKDFLVGVWLAYGLAREEGWHGLAVGLIILRDMAREHWEAMQPSAKRERARVGAGEWLVGRLVPLVAEWKSVDKAAPAILAATEALDEVDRVMNERLTKEQVAFGELVRALRPHAEAARRAAAEAAALAAREAERLAAGEVAPPAAAAPPPPDARQASAPPPPIAAAPPSRVAAPAAAAAPPPAGGADLGRAISQLETAMFQHAEALELANIFDPRGYILLRTAAWLSIGDLPAAQSDGRTMLRPPPQDQLTSVEALQQAGNHESAIRVLEGLVLSSPFFLDPHRQVCEALSALGARADQAKAAVMDQVAVFARRLPGIGDLAFDDGRPFANATTRDWLAGLATSQDQARDGAEADAGPAKAARQLADSGRLPDALKILSDEMRHVGGRARFNLQLLETQICLDANLAAVAVPLAIGLTRTASDQDLESWEPSLATRAAELAVRALTHAEAEKFAPDDERLLALHVARVRLAGLDPAAAARLAR